MKWNNDHDRDARRVTKTRTSFSQCSLPQQSLVRRLHRLHSFDIRMMTINRSGAQLLYISVPLHYCSPWDWDMRTMTRSVVRCTAKRRRTLPRGPGTSTVPVSYARTSEEQNRRGCIHQEWRIIVKITKGRQTTQKTTILLFFLFIADYYHDLTLEIHTYRIPFWDQEHQKKSFDLKKNW